MFCSKCGSSNPEDASFCWSCGSPIQKGQPSPHAQQNAGEQPQPISAPPPAPSSYSARPFEVEYAGFWLRFGAWIIDWLILAIPSKILGLMFGISMFPFLFDHGDWSHKFHNMSDIGSIFSLVMMGAQIWFLLKIMEWLYYAFFESSKFQATPGKMALGIVVTDMHGKPINFFKATARHLGKMVSTIILGFGWLMAGWTQKKQALHDIIADCLVVKKDRGY